MWRALEVPLDGAIVGVQGQARRGIQVVARAQVRVPRCRVAGAEQDQVGFRVVVAAQPRCRTAGLPQVAGPGLACLAAGNAVFDRLAVLVHVAHVPFHGRAHPQQFAVFRVVGLDLAHHAKLAAGNAGDQLAVDDHWRGADGVAFLVVGHLLAPYHLASVLVQRHQLGIEGAEEHQVAVQRHAAVDHVAARADVIGQARIVLPQLLAGTGVHGEHPRVGAGQVHHPVLDQRLGLLAALLLTTERKRPDRPQVLDVVGIEQVQRAVALALHAQAIGHDLLRVLRVLENFFIADSGVGCTGKQHGAEHQAQGEHGTTCGSGHDGYLWFFCCIRENFPVCREFLVPTCLPAIARSAEFSSSLVSVNLRAPPCGSGLVSRKGCKAAPAISAIDTNSGAASRPFRDTRPLPQGAALHPQIGDLASTRRSCWRS
ncbi:hypothetical protein D3C72_1018410 [compost metagenome]